MDVNQDNSRALLTTSSITWLHAPSRQINKVDGIGSNNKNPPEWQLGSYSRRRPKNWRRNARARRCINICRWRTQTVYKHAPLIWHRPIIFALSLTCQWGLGGDGVFAMVTCRVDFYGYNFISRKVYIQVSEVTVRMTMFNQRLLHGCFHIDPYIKGERRLSARGESRGLMTTETLI